MTDAPRARGTLVAPSPGADPSSDAPPDRPAARPHLWYLDGIRALTAVYVVIFHAWQPFAEAEVPPYLLPRSVRWATLWMSLGRPAVGIFIVLSGYCLMLPVARSRDGTLQGGVAGFLRRRARRILPPYYAALVLSVLLIWLFPAMRFNLDPGSVLTHSLLIHNLFILSIYGINTPMWSVATEFQIYLAFALLLLPIRRRLGDVASVAAAFVAGVALCHLFQRRFLEASPDYLGLFAFGMLAAVVNFSDRPAYRRLERVLPWGAAALGIALVYLGITVATHALEFGPRSLVSVLLRARWPMNTLVGLATACALVHWTRATHRTDGSRPDVFQRLLSSGPAVRVGAFSYSLYLVHGPILALLQRGWIETLGLSPTAMLLASIGLGLPLSLGLAYAFHLAFERPFLSAPASRPPRTTRPESLGCR